MLISIIKSVIYVNIFLLLIVLLPGNILLDIEPKEFSQQLLKSFDGPLEPNNELSKATKLFSDQIYGAESIAVFNGKLVTGALDGYIYQIDGNNLKQLVKLVERNCSFELHYAGLKCGRPLGMKFDSKGTLYVVEAYVGVFSVENIFDKNPKINLVLDIEVTKALGKASKFLDDLVIDDCAGLDGGHVLYVTDVSVKHDFYQAVMGVLGSDPGRIIKYDINAKKVESSVENLLFPNGIEITDDRTAILINEFIGRQVIKHYIKGPKVGIKEVLMKTLPGEPDNIRRSASKEETYWIAFFGARTSDNPNVFDYLLSRPLLRKLYARLLHLFGNIIELFGKLFRNRFIKKTGFEVKNGNVYNLADYANYGLIIEVDKNGQIVNSLHSKDGSIGFISEVREIRVDERETALYLGSVDNNYIGKLSLFNR